MADRVYQGSLDLAEKGKPTKIKQFLVVALDKLHIRGNGSARRSLIIEQTTASKQWTVSVYETGATEGAGNFGVNLVGSGNVILLTGVGGVRISSLPAYANNAAALAAGQVAGNLYRTNGDPDTVCVVH